MESGVMAVRSMSTVSGSARPGSRSLLGSALAVALALLAASSDALAGQGDCAQPQSTGSTPTATDCGFVLKASVGSFVCPLCICDVNNSAGLTTVDALFCLKKAVGQNVPLSCPPCDVVTTTTISGNSTTSTSTTSTSTTIPVNCSSNADCSQLPDDFRCNPNTGTCETPCTRTRDCKDFYECNKTTGYCEEPALLF